MYDRKFDIALRASHGPHVIEQINSIDNAHKIEIRLINEHLTQLQNTTDNLIVNHNIYPVLLEKLFSFPASLHKFGISKIAGVIRRTIRIQSHTIFKNIQDYIKPNVTKYTEQAMTDIRSARELGCITYGHNVMTTIVDKIPITDSTRVKNDADQCDVVRLAKACTYSWNKLGVEFR